MTTTTARRARVTDLVVGDILCRPDGTRPQVITAIRPVTTTSAGTARRRPPVQLTIISRATDGDTRGLLYSDTVYRTTKAWVRTR